MIAWWCRLADVSPLDGPTPVCFLCFEYVLLLFYHYSRFYESTRLMPIHRLQCHHAVPTAESDFKHFFTPAVTRQKVTSETNVKAPKWRKHHRQEILHYK